MNPLEQALLSEATGGAEPIFLLRTATRIDTGRWWRSSPLWIAVMKGEVILLAIGRRRYLERIPIAGCGGSFYNPAMGGLVLAPVEAPRFRQLRMKPSQALKILSLISSTTPTST